MEVSDGSADRLQTQLDPVMVPREVPEDVFFKFTDLKRLTLFVEARKLFRCSFSLVFPRLRVAQRLWNSSRPDRKTACLHCW